MEINTASEDLIKRFNKAASYLTSITSDVLASDLLYFYARYKQSTEGPCNIVKPGLFDIKGKKKWEAWKELGSLSKDEAMEQYIDKLSQIEPDWENSSPSKIGWVCVSTMMKDDIPDDHIKNVFDFVQENDLEKLKALPLEELYKQDENLMNPLHWACDRGFVDIARYILEKSPQNLNCQEIEGQTPLHYAVSCGHEEIVKLLLQYKAETTVKDFEGTLPIDCTQDESIIKLLNSSS